MVALRGKRQRWRTSCFAPSVKDAVAIRMDDRDSMLGENNLAAEISKGAQADEGMGEGGHNMVLHSCWWEGWGRGYRSASNRPHWEAVRHVDTNGGSRWVEVGQWGIRCKVDATGTGVGNACVGSRKVGGITARRCG
jgi:hypothetical protein